MAQGGFIKLYRKIRQNWKWPKKEPYSRVEAWEDLIMEAAYKDTDRLIDEKLYHLKRGQLIASSRYLARRWHWGRAKVRSFIEKLLETKEIAQKTTQGMTQITILKYDTYNPPQPTKQPTDNPAKGKNFPKNDPGNDPDKSTKYRTCGGEEPTKQPTDNPLTSKKQPKSKKVIYKEKIVEDSAEFRLASLLFQKIQERKPDYKKPNLQSWARDIGLMLRIDKRKPEIVEQVIVWCQADDFWQNNILSTRKLRVHFDKLELQTWKPKRSNGKHPAEPTVAEVPVPSLEISEAQRKENVRKAKKLLTELGEKKGMPGKGNDGG